MAGKRLSNGWKNKVESAQLTLTRTTGQVAIDSKGQLTVTESFMKQYAMVELARRINSGEVTTGMIMAARREEITGGGLVPVG